MNESAELGEQPRAIVAAPGALDAIVYNEQGLVPAIVQAADSREVLMMGWMTAETLAMSLEQGRTVFWSRSRQEVWRKGDTSGDHQYVQSVHYDCDGDVLLFQVEQVGAGACHTGAYSCFYRSISEAAPADLSSDSDASSDTGLTP